MELAGYQRRALRAAAHGLQPIAHVGKDGLTENVLEGVREALAASPFADPAGPSNAAKTPCRRHDRYPFRWDQPFSSSA